MQTDDQQLPAVVNEDIASIVSAADPKDELRLNGGRTSENQGNGTAG
jgi:hypothetical protein